MNKKLHSYEQKHFNNYKMKLIIITLYLLKCLDSQIKLNVNYIELLRFSNGYFVYVSTCLWTMVEPKTILLLKMITSFRTLHVFEHMCIAGGLWFEHANSGRCYLLDSDWTSQMDQHVPSKWG